MATDNEILQQIEKTNAERQLLDLQIELNRYKCLRKSSKTRIMSMRKRKIVSPDKIVFGGLQGTLGEKTLSVGYEMELVGWKSKCIAFLSRNVIIDFSNLAQLKAIGIKLTQLNNRFQLNIKGVERDIKEMNNGTKKVI